MYKELKGLRIYLCISMTFILLGAILRFFLNKGDGVIFLSDLHNWGLDLFFYIITYLGDGAFVALVGVGLIIYNRYYGLLFASILIPNALLVQFLKRIVFNYPRPLKFLGEEYYKIVKYVIVHTDFSFPSGHSNAVFAFMFCLCVISRNKKFQIAAAILAIFTAISRMYLYQHFLEDIVVGGFLALIISPTIYYFMFQRTSLGEKLNSRS